MIDGYMASKIARQEYEERVRSMSPVRDYDVHLTHTAGYWQAPRLESVLAAIATGVASLGSRFKHEAEAAADSSLTGQEQRPVSGDPMIEQRPKTAIS